MWSSYAIRYIKANRITSVFLAGISFLSAVLLSLTSGVFYNLWTDRVHRQILKTGDAPSVAEPIVIAYIVILIMVCASLTAMIHNAFEVSMNSRLHQLGILKSVGATPGQIRSMLLQEVLILCTIPAAAGVLTGFGLCYGFLQLIISVTAPVRKYDVIFQYHWGIGIASFALSMITVLLSAWIPARHISRLTSLEAIHSGADTVPGGMRHFPVISRVFGIYGELARKSLYARRKSLRTSTVSLMFSFLAFISFLNLEAISGLSTQQTYYERFRDVWDIMFTAEYGPERNQELLADIRGMEGVENCIAYQRFMAGADISREMLNDGLLGSGTEIPDKNVDRNEDGDYVFRTPVYVLDDASFQAYCTAQGITGETQAVVVNKIWDSAHSDRIHRTYLPLLDDSGSLSLNLVNVDLAGMPTVPVTVSSYSDAFPAIREDFIQYSLTLIISREMYQDMADSFPGVQVHYNIKAASGQAIPAIQNTLSTRLSEEELYTLQSRPEQESSEASMRNGLKIVIGALAGLLACIGITNIFSSVLGQIHQRRKEFARYLSAGLSPKGMRKILLMETLILSLNPLILSLVINVPITVFALHSACLPAKEFLQNAPVIPTLLFAAFVLLTVGLAYYLGGRYICRGNMVDVLKDETMV
ncbi:MAG: ABC transporter permease [Hungatella hathewayi]|nr:ABC transporter permease [Hungatella hathewayi]